jgi:hypothetical protein
MEEHHLTLVTQQCQGLAQNRFGNHVFREFGKFPLNRSAKLKFGRLSRRRMIDVLIGDPLPKLIVIDLAVHIAAKLAAQFIKGFHVFSS